jgi:MHS family proline/betaine transporter-like MFS transporter
MRSKLGSVIEYYDFALYGLLASDLSHHFLNTAHNNNLVVIFLIFAAGIVSRLVGSLVFSHYGDRNNHYQAIHYAILMMVASTGLVACLPSYAHIGLWSTYLLLSLRILQGISAGGQYAGILLVLGNKNPKKRAQHAAPAYCYAIAGLMLASLVTHLCFRLIPNNNLAFRAPFLLSFALGLFYYFFPNDAQQHKQTQHRLTPILVIFTQYRRAFIYSTILGAIGGVYYYGLFIYLLNWHFTHFPEHKETIYLLYAGLLVLSALGVYWFAMLGDRYGRKGCFLASFIGLLVGYPLLFQIMSHTHSVWLSFFCYWVLMLLFACFTSNAAAQHAEYFPPHVRYTGLAVSYNLGIALLGSFAPSLMEALSHHFNNLFVLSTPMILTSLLGLAWYRYNRRSGLF